MLSKIHRRAICTLGIISLAIVVGCGDQMPANVDRGFLKAIGKTRQRLERPFLATYTEDNFLKVYGQRSYYGLSWSFPTDQELLQKVQFKILEKDLWQSIYPGDVNWKGLKSFDALANFPVLLFNRWYSARATESPRQLAEIFEEKLFRVGNDVFLEGLYLMQPYHWSMQKFLQSDGVSNIEWISDEKDADLAILRCDVDFSEEQSPLCEALKGTWTAKFCRSKKMLIEQSIENPLISCQYTYRFDDPASELPTSTSFDATSRDSADPFTATSTTKFLKIELDHGLKDDVCFLSYHDLPEPIGFRSKTLWTSRNIMFGVMVLIVIGLIGNRLRQNRTR